MKLFTCFEIIVRALVRIWCSLDELGIDPQAADLIPTVEPIQESLESIQEAADPILQCVDPISF